MIPSKIKVSAAFAAVAAAFAAPAGAAVVVGAGSSAVNAGMLNYILQDDCNPYGSGNTVQLYDNSSSAPTKLAAGSVFTVSCTPQSGAHVTSNPFSSSYDTTGGSWKSYTATTSSFFTTAQASSGNFNYVKTIDPASTTCSGTLTAFTATLANGSGTTVDYLWGCTISTVGQGTNTDVVTFGLADVEPKLYTGSTANQPLVDGSWNTTPTGLLSPFTLGPELTGFGTTTTPGVPVFGIVWGIAASGALYGAMQNDQLLAGVLPSTCGTGTAGSTTIVNTTAACAPLLSKNMYADIVANTGGAGLSSAAPLFITPSNYSDLSLELARRDQGSGTQAASNAYFMNVACSSTTTEGPDTPVLPYQSSQQTSGGFPNIVTYSPSTSDVTQRLQGYPTTVNGLTNAYPTSHFVIGAVAGTSYSSSAPGNSGSFGGSTAPWGFLALEGVVPTVTNFTRGFISYSSEEYLHCSSTATGDQAAVCNDLAGKGTSPSPHSLITYSTTNSTGIYPIATANGSTYYTNGKTCSGVRHH
jgi:hypothetical protein